MSHRLLILAGVLCALTTPLAAQVHGPTDRPQQGGAAGVDTRGLQLGIGLNGSSLSAQDFMPETESGGGLFFRIGYGITPRLTVFAGAAGASMNDGEYGLGQVDVGARGYFPGASRWVPFVEGALTARALIFDKADLGTADDLEIFGGGFTLGGGIDFYARSSLSLGAALAWTFGEFTEAKMGDRRESLGDDAFNAGTARFNLGLTWWP
jgi:hypothetical protein